MYYLQHYNLKMRSLLLKKLTIGFNCTNKEEPNKEKEKTENKSLFSGNLFLENNNKIKNENEQNTSSLFSSNNTTTNIFGNKDKDNDNDNEKKNNKSSLFGGETKVNNILLNTEKETKTVKIDAINTSGSLFSTDVKSNNLFATSLFNIKQGEQWISFTYENKKKKDNFNYNWERRSSNIEIV